MSVRLRRLQADYEQIKEGVRGHPAISILGVSGTPPERYQIEYRVRSLSEAADGSVSEKPRHVAEIHLTLAYPRQAPQCRLLTPVFHPNIAPHAVCIGDHWAAGESLLELIVRVGEMLAFQSYNTKSPLNGGAARWVEEHLEALPTDARDLTPKVWVDPAGRPASDDCCHNCSATGGGLVRCSTGHLVCDDCRLQCARCGASVCLLCGLETCAECGLAVCDRCRSSCPQCQRGVCLEHMRTCAVCATPGCPDCSIECATCSTIVCLAHVSQCAECQDALCPEHAHACPSCGRVLCSKHFDRDRGVCPACCAAPKPEVPGFRRVRCGSCGGGIRVRPDQVGKRLRCPRCRAPLTVA